MTDAAAPTSPFDSTWLVIPAFNESAVLGAVVTQARQRFPQVVVVDDCSTDNTAAVAHDAGAHVVRHPINLGQGAALQTGFRYALSQGASAVATFDADDQHDVGDLEKMTLRLFEGGYDAVIGSRFLGDASTVPFARRLLLKAAVLFTWVVSGVRLTDAHNGLRVFRAAAAARINLRQNRMAHASEIINQIKSLDLKYTEHPVTIRYTEHSMRKGQRWHSSIAILRDLFLGSLTP